MRDPSQLCLSSLNCLEQDSLKMLKLLLLADTPQVSHLWASAMMAASWPSRLPTCLNRMRRKMSPMTPSSSEMSLTRKQNQNHETMTTYLHGRSWGWGLSEHSALMQAIPGFFNWFFKSAVLLHCQLDDWERERLRKSPPRDTELFLNLPHRWVCMLPHFCPELSHPQHWADCHNHHTHLPVILLLV